MSQARLYRLGLVVMTECICELRIANCDCSNIYRHVLQRPVWQICNSPTLWLLSILGTELATSQTTYLRGDSPLWRRRHQSSGNPPPPCCWTETGKYFHSCLSSADSVVSRMSLEATVPSQCVEQPVIFVFYTEQTAVKLSGAEAADRAQCAASD